LTKQEKYNNRKPWILEDETGEHQYQSQLEASQSATSTYYLLMMHGKEFHAVPAGSWYSQFAPLLLFPLFHIYNNHHKNVVTCKSKRYFPTKGYRLQFSKFSINNYVLQGLQ
jgi:hypothetical protein